MARTWLGPRFVRNPFPLRTWGWIGLTSALLAGWSLREVAFAREKAAGVAAQTVTLDRVEMRDYQLQGQPGAKSNAAYKAPIGRIGLYVQGDTPASSQFVTGRFVLEPGKSPHPPHTHIEEEVMIVETGTGEIVCDGKTTKVGPGSVMYTTPNAPHGIINTGTTPLTFYFIKWASKNGPAVGTEIRR